MTPVMNHNLVIGQKPPAGRGCYVMSSRNEVLKKKNDLSGAALIIINYTLQNISHKNPIQYSSKRWNI